MYANRARRCPSGAKDLGMQKNEKHSADSSSKCEHATSAPLNQKISGKEKKGK